MNRREFPWLWLSVSLLLFMGTPIIYLFVVMPYAARTSDPDAIAFEGFCLGIILMPIGFFSLLTLAVWMRRKKQRSEQELIRLNSDEKP